MSEPRRSTRARAREEAAEAAEAVAAPEARDTPSKPSKSSSRASKPPAKSLKRKAAAISKDSTPATPAAESPQLPLKPVLPTRIVDGQPLPTLPEPQPLDLPLEQYQDIQQSGVLSASLQRSRALWITGVNFKLFHALFVPPKKVADRTDADKQAIQRQKELVRNFPQLGATVEAQLVIEPHTFPIRLYGPREVVRQPPKKPPPPPQYGQWPNHSQYPSYQQHQPYHNPHPPYQKPPPPQQRPPPPKPVQKPLPPPPATTTPAPDPVIHMLAQRAGTDPQLKAVMKIVAGGQATKEQLEFFQGHINELTNMLQKQKEAAAKAPRPPPQAQQPPAQQPQPPPPKPQSQPHHQSQPQQTSSAPTPGPASMATPSPHPPQPPYRPPQQHHQSSYQHQTPQQNARPYAPSPHAAPQPYAAPPPPRPAPHPNQYTYQQPQYNHGNSYSHVQQPPMTTYRPLVFDFVEGNGDKFYFPSYSFMEWLPNNQGVKFSFLVTKMKPKPKEEATPKVPSTPAAKADATPVPTPAPASGSGPVPGPSPSQTPGQNTGEQSNMSAAINSTPGSSSAPNGAQTMSHANPNTPSTSAQTAPPKPAPQYIPPPRIEDFDEKKDIKDIEFYQPVTVVVLSTHFEILQSLPRAVRPPDVVEKYMNEVFDTCKRAEETYLAFRLPREGAQDVEAVGARAGTPLVSTPVPDEGIERKKSISRPRKSIAV